MQKIKKPLSIILAVIMVMSVFIAVPVSASALTIDDVQSLLSSMEAKMNDYYAQGDWDRAEALKNYYDGLDGELEYAEGQITPELENAYNAAYEYFMAGVSYPDVNNVYRATNGQVNVAVSDLQPGDVLVTSSDTLSVRKGDCDIVLVGGTYCKEETLSQTYPNNVTLGNNLSFHFSDNFVRIIDGDKSESYSPVYNNALGNAYMVIGKENGTVYLAGYYFAIYTITWKNGDDVIKTDTVEEGATPTYDGETPTKAEDEQYTYTFTGWTDSSNTFYSKDSDLPAASKDETYTATYSETAKTKPWPSNYTITTGGVYNCPSTLSQYTIVSGGTEENPVVINITDQTSGNYPINLKSGYLKIVGNNNTFSGYSGLVFFSENAINEPNGEAHLTVTDLTITSYRANNQYIQIKSANYMCQSTVENVTFKNWNNPNASGAVVIENNTTHIFKNCTFEGNTGGATGGLSAWSNSEVIMEGCTFKNCKAFNLNTSRHGGGAVWACDNAKLTLDGCTFENCIGKFGAVGIESTASLTLKGDTTITGNTTTSNANGNLYLPTGATFNVAEDFTGTVGVSTQTAPTDSASVTLASGLADTQAALANNNIVSDNENYDVRYDSNKLFLVVPATYTVTWKNGDDVLETDENVAEGATPTYDGTTPTKASDKYYDYTFSGWTPAVAPVTEDVTYTAQFTATAKTFKVSVKKLTGGTYTIENLTGETTVSQLKEIIADQIDIPATAQRLIFAGKELEDAKTLAEYNIEKESTIHLITRGYTVTWLNYDNSELGKTTVQYGATPSYDGETPTKPEDEQNTYTFAGWTPEITAVTGDATYKATYTATAKTKDLFPQHSITLGGNIGVNFYIDSAAANFASASEATVKFTCDGKAAGEVDLKGQTPDANGYYKATCDVVAAQMAHKIHAEVYLDGEKLEQIDDYSVQDYAETVFANPEEYDSEKPEQLKALAQALLNYGANAQTVFDSALTEKPALANKTVGNNGYADVTAEQIGAAINGTASNLNAIAEQLGAKYYTNSLIYLSKNTLRIYFTPTSYPGEIPNAGAYDGNLSGYYYYVDHANIPAAELDDQQTFTVGGTTFTFSALDYAKAVVESTKMEPEQKNLAKALYLYNQKANAYFG